jgi:hypothetical protein
MKAGPLTTLHRCAKSSRGFARLPQFVFLAALLVAIPTARAGELRPGNAYPLTLTDVDQHQLSTSDGHVTIITVVTRKDEQKAQIVGDRFSRMYRGDPRFRLITVVNFQQRIFPPFRGIATAIIRQRLDGEAKELQKIYAGLHLNRNARSDIFVVADFDGKTVSQLDIMPASTEFAVFMFDGHGRLIRRWSDVPSAEALTAAINEAR